MFDAGRGWHHRWVHRWIWLRDIKYRSVRFCFDNGNEHVGEDASFKEWPVKLPTSLSIFVVKPQTYVQFFHSSVCLLSFQRLRCSTCGIAFPSTLSIPLYRKCTLWVPNLNVPNSRPPPALSAPRVWRKTDLACERVECGSRTTRGSRMLCRGL